MTDAVAVREVLASGEREAELVVLGEEEGSGEDVTDGVAV